MCSRMRRKRYIWILLVLAGWMQACLSTTQMERGRTTTFDKFDWQESDPTLQFYTPEILNALTARVETKGRAPNEGSIVSILDRLIEKASYRPDSVENETEAQVAKVVAQLLRDPSEEIRFRAAELLGMMGGPSQEESLIASSEKDPSPAVREMAAESLEHLGLGNEVWTE